MFLMILQISIECVEIDFWLLSSFMILRPFFWIYTAGFYWVWWSYCSHHPYHSVNGKFTTGKSKIKYAFKSCNIEFVCIFHRVFLLLTLPDRQWEDSFWWRPSKVNMVLLSSALHFAYTMHRHFYFGNIPSGSLQIKLGKDYSI